MTEEVSTEKSENWIRRLYQWTLRWAEKRNAQWALGGLSFIESSFFPIPPDPLLMALCFSQPKKWFRFALICTLTSVLGGVLGYYIGFAFWETIGKPIVDFYHGQEIFDKVQHWYDEYGFLGILLAAITPIPYKVFTIASGVFQFSLPMLIAASLVGRGFRFFLVAGIIRFFGPRIRPYLEKYLEVATVVMAVIGILGFLALKWLK
ncbi:MAG: YqaA family protein [Verrucomicrobiota bacterium]